MDTQYKAIDSKVQVISESDRVLSYVVSTEEVDRHGDIVRQKGWDIENWKRTGMPVLYGHEGWAPRIAKGVSFSVMEGKTPYAISTAKFPEEGVYSFADTIYKLAKAGFMSTTSVGFRPKKIVEVESDEERSKLGLGRYGRVFEEAELFEWSIVSIPANAGASMLEAVGKGIITPREAQWIDNLAVAMKETVERIAPELAQKQAAQHETCDCNAKGLLTPERLACIESKLQKVLEAVGQPNKTEASGGQKPNAAPKVSANEVDLYKALLEETHFTLERISKQER